KMNARPIIDTASSMSLQRRPSKTRAIPSNPTQNVGTYVGLAFSSHHFIVQKQHDKVVDCARRGLENDHSSSENCHFLSTFTKRYPHRCPRTFYQRGSSPD